MFFIALVIGIILMIMSSNDKTSTEYKVGKALVISVAVVYGLCLVILIGCLLFSVSLAAIAV